MLEWPTKYQAYVYMGGDGQQAVNGEAIIKAMRVPGDPRGPPGLSYISPNSIDQQGADDHMYLISHLLPAHVCFC